MLKKKWEKPKLVVLVRGTSVESVLVTCKDVNVAGAAGFNGYNGVHNTCQSWSGCCTSGCDVNAVS